MAEALRLTRERAADRRRLPCSNEGLGGAAVNYASTASATGMLARGGGFIGAACPEAGGLLDTLQPTARRTTRRTCPASPPFVRPTGSAPRRRLLQARLVARFATSPTSTQPGPGRTTSMFLPATPASRCRSSSCCTVAPRAPRTSRPAPG